MNQERLAELYLLLREEYSKPTINNARIAEINYYISQEFMSPQPQPQPQPNKSQGFWDHVFEFKLPENWKTYATAALGVLVAFNGQFHWVSADVQNSLLAVAVSLGFWAVGSMQMSQFTKIKAHLANIRQK